MHSLGELEVRVLELILAILWQRAVVVEVGGCVEYVVLRYVVQVLVGQDNCYLSFLNHIGFVVKSVNEVCGISDALDKLDIWTKVFPRDISCMWHNDNFLHAR